jgi:hypothetical protein
MNGKISKFHAIIGRPALNKLTGVIFSEQKVAPIWMDEL